MAITYKVIQKRNPLDPSAPKKFYGQAVRGRKIDFKKLSIEIAETSTTVSDGDTYAVLITAAKLISKYLGLGYMVELEDIGTFYVSISSEGADTEEKYHQGLIRKAKIIFKVGVVFAALLKNLTFEKQKTPAAKNP